MGLKAVPKPEPEIDLQFMSVPAEDEFTEDYLAAPRLNDIINKLRVAHPQFSYFRSLTIHCLWKKEGGGSKGKMTLGKIQAVKGLLFHYAEADFVIWLAADRFRGEGNLCSRKVVEAALFHELSHLFCDPENGNIKLRGHDIEAFITEIEVYGLWKTDLEKFVQTVRQLPLFAQEDEDVHASNNH